VRDFWIGPGVSFNPGTFVGEASPRKGLFTGVRGIRILRSSHSGFSPKFVLDLLLRNGCRNAQETVVL
jgi:hypothetical protein